MKTVIETAKVLGIPVYKVYDEIRAGRVETKKVKWRVMLTEKGFRSLKNLEKRKNNMTPLRDYLKRKRISVSQYYRMRYEGKELSNMVKIGGRLFIKEKDNVVR